MADIGIRKAEEGKGKSEFGKYQSTLLPLPATLDHIPHALYPALYTLFARNA